MGYNDLAKALNVSEKEAERLWTEADTLDADEQYTIGLRFDLPHVQVGVENNQKFQTGINKLLPKPKKQASVKTKPLNKSRLKK